MSDPRRNGEPETARLQVREREGDRLDRYLSTHLSISRTRAADLIAAGCVRVALGVESGKEKRVNNC